MVYGDNMINQAKRTVISSFSVLFRDMHSGSSGWWEERTKLREKVTLKFTSPTLPIMPTAFKIKLMKLGS